MSLYAIEFCDLTFDAVQECLVCRNHACQVPLQITLLITFTQPLENLDELCEQCVKPVAAGFAVQGRGPGVKCSNVDGFLVHEKRYL